MKAAVGIMGVLIIIGTTVVVGTVIHRLYASFATPSTPQTMASAPVSAVPVEMPAGVVAQLAPGERISGIAPAGAELAVWLSGPKGDRLLLLNPVTGQARVVLASP